MSDRCPTCGHITLVSEAEKLLHLLQNGEPHREVYRARDGGWFVSYGGGQVSTAAVDALVSRGLIVSVYNNCPHDAYHVGKTLDVAATVAERRKHKHWRDAPRVYVGDTPAQTIEAGTGETALAGSTRSARA